MRTVEKVALFASIVAVIVLVLMLLRPWIYGSQYTFEYLRGRAVEVAEAIEQRHPVRLVEDWSTEHVSLTLAIIKPKEEPLILSLEYDRLRIKVPVYAKEIEVIRGSPPDKGFERFRRVSVYHEGSWVIVDPKPTVNYYVVMEYGRMVHVVEITLFIIKGKLEPGVTLSYANSTKVVYLRSYDYAGIASITIDGEVVARIHVKPQDLLKLVIVCECWSTG
ncbi:MAG: hypothetical protein DRJ60_05300 [Thermoprotei archaeon]|nr:MAG: hypothetical protein DRJ60_05300 [Thermoprotei archaeon]